MILISNQEEKQGTWNLARLEPGTKGKAVQMLRAWNFKVDKPHIKEMDSFNAVGRGWPAVIDSILGNGRGYFEVVFILESRQADMVDDDEHGEVYYFEDGWGECR